MFEKDTDNYFQSVEEQFLKPGEERPHTEEVDRYVEPNIKPKPNVDEGLIWGKVDPEGYAKGALQRIRQSVNPDGPNQLVELTISDDLEFGVSFNPDQPAGWALRFVGEASLPLGDKYGNKLFLDGAQSAREVLGKALQAWRNGNWKEAVKFENDAISELKDVKFNANKFGVRSKRN